MIEDIIYISLTLQKEDSKVKIPQEIIGRKEVKEEVDLAYNSVKINDIVKEEVMKV